VAEAVEVLSVALETLSVEVSLSTASAASVSAATAGSQLARRRFEPASSRMKADQMRALESGMAR
jgi:hypothetical protein